ncbi:MAG TPA: DUF4157 domain-containing protein, partial [Thermoanaerobaculia bacterium]
RQHASASPLHRRRVEDRQSCLSGRKAGQAGLPVLHSLQRAVGNHTIATAIRDGLAAPSQPLDFALRTGMERRLGHDFSNVRVHVDPGAAARVEARAFAFGDDIVLASHKDRATLPHELTHVAQQRGRALTMPTRLAQPHEPAEQHADAPPAPDALHRTPDDKVSCGASPLTLSDGTKVPNPANRISAAETIAVHWLRKGIAELAYTLGRIRAGAAPGFPVISDALGVSLRLVGLNPDAQVIWNGSGPGTAEYVLERLRAVQAILGWGKVYYHCTGERLTQIGNCNPSNDICVDANAETCPLGDEIALCLPFWKSTSLDMLARILLHEHFHLISRTLGHSGRLHNIYCYERFVQTLSGVSTDFQMDSCPDPS